METILLVAAVVFVALVAVGGYAAVKATRALGRQVDKALPAAQRKVEGAALRARSIAAVGPVGEAVQLRLSLRETVDATRRVLETDVRTDSQLTDSMHLLQRLERQAAVLDRELAALERDPQRARIAEKLAELKERAGKVGSALDALRFAALDRRRHTTGEDLDALAAEAALEAGALRHWSDGQPEVEGLVEADPGELPEGGSERPEHPERPEKPERPKRLR